VCFSGLDKRAHHNALERKRRDHIKESFSGLRDAIPTMHGDKSSRAQILKKASEYITFMRKKNSTHQREIDELKSQNGHLEVKRDCYFGTYFCPARLGEEMNAQLSIYYKSMVFVSLQLYYVAQR
jgi:hypothetical protein